MRSQALRSAVVRIRVLQVFLAAAFVVLAVRAGQLTVGDLKWGTLGEDQVNKSLEIHGARGLILDRDHRELAITVEAPSVYIEPRQLNQRQSTIAELSRILARPRAELDARIGQRTSFLYLARWISREQAGQIERLNLKGVGIEHEPRRTYPAGPMAASLLGFVNLDGKGVRGVEQMMDSWLRGRTSSIPGTRDGRGRRLPEAGDVDPRKNAGGDIKLAVDWALQARAESALARTMASSGARRGVVVVVEPRTGDILTLAEAPGFDPNSFRNLAYAATRSHAFSDAVEPGSTFKAFLVGAALDAGVLDEETIIDTGPGELRVPGKTIADKRKIGATDAAGVLRHSSNVGAVLIAQALGAERYREFLDRMGFGHGTGSGFPSESAGLMRRWQDWKPVDQANIAFGQGINVTVIQLAMAAAALANDGELMRPRIVLARRRPLESWQEQPPVSEGQAMEPAAAQAVMKMLETVVSAQGTGRRAALANVQVAGKTGTAQLLDPSGTYSRTRHTAWFLGLAPAENPKVAIVVALEEPEEGGGGAVAAPLFAEVATAQLARYGIITWPEPIRAAPLPTSSMSVALASADDFPVPRDEFRPVAGLAVAKPPVSGNAPDISPAGNSGRFGDTRRAVLVPNFRGANLASAQSLASDEALELLYRGSGSGRVISQKPAPGTILGGERRTVVVNFARLQGEG
ncbi:MAG: penicillin-binding transpeptidase domain-containing protein [Myxococcota bacterium]|nr:penicillin-binding transpeptidase domain-containing protein [Myxococcota bacterium]